MPLGQLEHPEILVAEVGYTQWEDKSYSGLSPLLDSARLYRWMEQMTCDVSRLAGRSLGRLLTWHIWRRPGSGVATCTTGVTREQQQRIVDNPPLRYAQHGGL